MTAMPHSGNVTPALTARLVAILISLSSVSWDLLAATPDTSQWRCTLCPFQQGTQSQTAIGASYVSDDAFRYGHVTGYDDEGLYPVVAGHGQVLLEASQLSWQVDDLGVASRSVALRLQDPGHWKVAAGYRERPQRVDDTTATVFAASAAGALTLPDDWTRSPVTSGFSDLTTHLGRRHLASDRTEYTLEYVHHPRADIRVFADLKRQERDGTGVLGGANFTSASLLPHAIDYTTDELDLGVQFTGDAGYATLSAYGSTFSNGNDSLVWDNPFTSFPGAQRGRLAQAPDNHFLQLSLNGAHAIGASTQVSAAASLGRMIQDDQLLPYKINANLDAGPLPISDLDGRVDTTNVTLGVRSRLWSKVKLDLKYRFDERNNQTRSVSWSRVIVDSLLSGNLATNTPYSYRRSRFTGRVQSPLHTTLHASAEFAHVRTDRDFQEVAEQEENTGSGSLRWRPLTHLDIEVKAGTAKRQVDRYNLLIAQQQGQNPLLRKYNLAHRYRKFGELVLNTAWPERRISMSTTFAISDDDYSQSVLGLLGSDEWQLSADASWALTDQTLLYASVSREDIESTQAGSGSFTTPDWRARLSDQFTTYSFGLRMGEFLAKTDVSLNYSRAVGESEIGVATTGAASASFPDLASDFDSINFELTYHHTRAVEWVVAARYERFKTQDWTDVAPAAMTQILTLGASPYNYSVFHFQLSLRYRVGT